MQVILGNKALTSDKVYLTAVRNAALPQVVYSTTKRGGYQGTKLVQPTFASYKFILEWVIIGDSFEDLALQRRNFAQILGSIHSDGAQTLQITTDDNIVLEIDIKAFDMVGDFSAGDGVMNVFTTTLEAEYPFLQSAFPTSQDITIYNGGGFAVPFAIPLDMSAGHSTSVSIINNGNYPAYPIFTFTGALTNPTLTNDTTGESISLSYTLADNTASIKIDTYERTVIIKPSGNNGRQYVTGTFFTLPIGTNSLTLGNANTTDAGKCTVTFKDTYLGI